MQDMPLLIFTLCMQGAIGAMLWAVIMRLKDSKAPLYKRNTLVALVLSGIGIVASLLHLGQPLLALTSLLNLSTSWLSREILFSGGFFGLLLVYWWLERGEKAAGARSALSYLTVLVGLGAIYTMGRLYMEGIMPAWQSSYTMISFYATAIILGGIIFYLTSSVKEEPALPIDLILLAVAMIQAAFMPGYMANLASSATMAGQESMTLMAGSEMVLGLSWLCLLGGLLLFTLTQRSKLAKQSSILYLAVAVIFLGEIASRYIFYASGIPIGFGL
ncbi:MAG: dimethyl sulfoxide reductase anchor subunit [Desulfitobacterium sp.]|nr:dimethyl sulfoxide reductase anchor subunit [Desulfitobacterium sp.]